jgi:hypothetical protein
VIVAVLAIDKEENKGAPSFSLALGLCSCLITIKIIVYSMACMAYASLRFDIIPFIVVLMVSTSGWWREMGEIGALRILLGVLDLFYVVHLSYWIHEAITQLCDRLQIKLFQIPYKVVSAGVAKKGE